METSHIWNAIRVLQRRLNFIQSVASRRAQAEFTFIDDNMTTFEAKKVVFYRDMKIMRAICLIWIKLFRKELDRRGEEYPTKDKRTMLTVDAEKYITDYSFIYKRRLKTEMSPSELNMKYDDDWWYRANKGLP